MGEVADAIILAAGRGTRMLPGSIYTPKEIMPLIDTPILNHLIWESCKAGVERIHIVISPQKRNTVSNIFVNRHNYLNNSIRPDLPRMALNPLPEGVEVIFHEQKSPGGVGDAILVAAKKISGPFLVLLGDNLLIEEHVGPEKSGPENSSNSSKKLVDYFENTGRACAGILKVPDDQVNKYGIVRLEGDLIKEIIEKPEIGNAPSNFILCGRYVLPENSEELLNLYPSSKFGELQSIVMFGHIIDNGEFGSVDLSDYVLYDSGDPINWLKSQIDHALRRPDLNEDFRVWLTERIRKNQVLDD